MKTIIVWGVTVITWVLAVMISHNVGYKRGLTHGIEVGVSGGYDAAIDTCQKIINAQIDNDSTVTELTIVSGEPKDTVSFFLSAAE